MSPPSHDDRPPGATAQGTGASEDVSAYLDGELTDAEIEAFEAELERNAALQWELDEIREVSEWLAADGPTAAPMGFANRVMARIDEEHPARPSAWAWLRRPFGLPIEGVVLALSAAIVLVLVLPRSAPEPASDDATEHPARQAPIEAEAPIEPPVVDVANTASPTDEDANAPREVAQLEAAVTTRLRDEKLREQTTAPPTTKTAEPPVEGKLVSGKGTGDLGLTESVTSPLPTNSDQVPSPSNLGTPTTKAPYTRPAPTTFEQAFEQALTLDIDIASDDPKMLTRVLKLSARFGGAKDANGQEIEDPTLEEGVRDVFVQVPQDQLLAFENQLAKLGYKVSIPPDQGLLAGTVWFHLRLVREPSVRRRADVEAAEAAE